MQKASTTLGPGGEPLAAGQAFAADPQAAHRCVGALRTANMVWSQNGMQTRSWRGVPRMIDELTHAETPDDLQHWFAEMVSAGVAPQKATFDSAIQVREPLFYICFTNYYF